MSKHKQAPQNHSNVVVGKKEKSRHFRPMKTRATPVNRAIIIVLSVMIVGIGMWGIWYFVGRDADYKSANSGQTSEQVSMTPQEEAYSNEGNGNLEAAEQAYTQWIAAAQTDDDKVGAYTGRALFYYNNHVQDEGRVATAIEDAQAAYQIAKDYNSAEIVAMLFDAQGNNEQAIAYYKLARDHLQKLIEGGSYDGITSPQKYQNAIERLGGE